jgi:hypothetical protein
MAGCDAGTIAGLVANSTERPLGLFPGKQSGGKLYVHGIVAAMAVDAVVVLALCVIGYIWTLQ